MSRSALLLLAICFSIAGPGCQSTRVVGAWLRPRWLPGRSQSVQQHEVVPVNRQADVEPDMLAHADESVPGPDELRDDNTASEQTGFWSRLKAPSRFLMPRTDAWLGSDDSDSSQDFDSGF